MLSTEINASLKIKIKINVSVAEEPFIEQIFCRGNSRKRKVIKFHKQILQFPTNNILTIRSTEIAGKQTGTF